MACVRSVGAHQSVAEERIENRATRIDTRRANERNWLVRARDSLAEENAKCLRLTRRPHTEFQSAESNREKRAFFLEPRRRFHFADSFLPALRLFILRLWQINDGALGLCVCAGPPAPPFFSAAAAGNARITNFLPAARFDLCAAIGSKSSGCAPHNLIVLSSVVNSAGIYCRWRGSLFHYKRGW